MSQNTIFKGANNLVSIGFKLFAGGIPLTDYDDVQITIGDETYTTLINDTQLIVASGTLLTLDIGVTTSLAVGSYSAVIKGILGSKVFLLTGPCLPSLGAINVC